MTHMHPHDRRRHPRLSAEAVSFLSAQLVGGARVKLLDVSHGGVRLETARHVRPGQTLAVRLLGGGGGREAVFSGRGYGGVVALSVIHI